MFETIKKSRIALLIGLGLIVGGATLATAGSGTVTPSEPIATAVPAAQPPMTLDTVYPASGFVRLAERVMPAVLRIEVTSAAPVARQSGRMPDELRRFFGEPRGGFDMPGPAPSISGGTGFLITQDGYIVTNHHVVGEATDITVTLLDRRTYPATLVGSDPTTDLAVIKIEGEGFPTIPFGSSARLQIGEWVMAVGNPGYGNGGLLDHTVTTGIVSAKRRPLSIIARSLQQDPEYGSELAGYAIENFIQTDAVINPGNSGGPMVNMRGEVVGVNAAIASTSGYYQGYGFAIPADLVRKVAMDLMEYGTVERAWLGVSVEGVTPEDAEVYGVPSVSGVLVQSVAESGPADDAGVRVGDVIYAVDGIVVDRGGHLQQLIAERTQGEKTVLTVYRDGTARDMAVTLGDAPVNERPAAAPAATRPSSQKLGLEIGDLDDAMAARLDYDRAQGAVVLRADPYGPAGRRGIRSGMLITEVNGRKVSSGSDVRELLGKVESGEVVSLRLVTPGGSRRIVNVRAR